MKLYFIFLCLVTIGDIAGATTQTTANQDKPARIYVKNYTMSDNGSSIDTYTYGYTQAINNQSFNASASWGGDGSGGSASWTALLVDSGTRSDGTVSDNGNWSWPASTWPALLATYTHTYTESFSEPAPYPPFYYTTSTTNENQSPPVFWEHCDINTSTNSPHYSREVNTLSTSERRTAQTTIKLQTGGKAISKLRNLFGIVAGGSEIQPNNPYQVYFDEDYGGSDYIFDRVPGQTIPSQNITVGSYGALNSGMVKYIILPDGVDVDVTPNVAGLSYYQFNVSQQKYHSYFTVYAEQGNPGGWLPNGSNDVGHAFWKFSTDAPSQFVFPVLTNLLGHAWGFYPNGGLFTHSGQVENDDSNVISANITRTFYIGFPDLVNGLQFTSGISNTPPIYTLLKYDCVDAAVAAGASAGVNIGYTAGYNGAPQYFAYYLSLRYPGTWLGNTNIFWP